CLDGGAESDDVAVRIDEDAFVLPPFSVLRPPHVRSGGAPLVGHFISIVDPDIRRAANRAGVAFGHESEVDLDPITLRVPVASACVPRGSWAVPPVDVDACTLVSDG